MEITSQQNNLANNLRASLIGYFSTVYITIINPLILSKSGMPIQDVFFATCITIALSGYFVSYFVKLPILSGPTMALNAYFVTGLCGNLGLSWPEALGITSISGILIMLLASTNIKDYLLDSIPHQLWHSITYGIGLFLAMIAINCSSIYDIPKHYFDLHNLEIFVLTIGIIFVIEYKKRAGSTIIALAVATIISCWLNHNIPEQIIRIPDLKFNTLLALQLPSKFDLNSLAAVFAVITVTIFDSGITGSIITKEFTKDPQLVKKKTKGLFRALGLGTIFGGMLGTSNTGSYLESLNVPQAKGSAGYIVIITGTLFLATILLEPLIFIIPTASTSAILFYIALNILKKWQFLKNLTWIDLTTSIAIIMIIPLNYSIPDGIGAGVIIHTILTRLFTKDYKISNNVLILCTMFILFFTTKLIY